jgi:aryl-alcohol dehydrogenase-like predicted oxidoreductase
VAKECAIVPRSQYLNIDNVNTRVELGVGLIGIGRPWGHIPGSVPSEAESLDFLQFAFDLGVRYFDTAPSYGDSERRLGKFLGYLTKEQRDAVTIATKFGEHWNPESSQPFVDHSFEALRASLDASRNLLGRIDVLQLHKTTADVLRSDDLGRAWEYARPLGVRMIGASVSDPVSAGLVIGDSRYECIQLPFNCTNTSFGDAVAQAAARGMWVAVNRPYAMGAMLYQDTPINKREAFSFILQSRLRGVILTGTKSKDHLRDNWQAFREAVARREG